ncbi:MAG: toll/interleukin-1 receptor domain-containing protein [Bacteroidales bacterium]|nr:toll/interleukin-1 receptor domain-containing protein [Clostridium sp.]MCM1204950.1 toll/interleukin-1 receptor domain-containing protein [Bacteroidales bacterium]
MSLKHIVVEVISFDAVFRNNHTGNPKILPLFAEIFCQDYQIQNKFELDYSLCYNMRKIIFFRRVDMRSECLIEIPYADRGEYIDFIAQINTLVDEDGLLILAVNNNPYVMESGLLVETNENMEQIQKLISENDLSCRQDKGLKEILSEIGNRRWNMAEIPAKASRKEIEEMMSLLYLYADRKSMDSKGYFQEYKKSRVFISYSHKDRDVVMDVYEKLQLAGMNCWIDMYDIEIGEVIAKRMLEGIKECDFAVFFLSENYSQSLMAKAELQNFLSSLFLTERKWYLIKLDEVDVDKIQAGLSNYKYYDLTANNNLDELVADMRKVLR